MKMSGYQPKIFPILINTSEDIIILRINQLINPFLVVGSVSIRDTSKYPKDCYLLFNSSIYYLILINTWILLQKWIPHVNLGRVTHWEYPLIITPYGTLAILKVPRRNYNKTLEYTSSKYANTEYKHIQAHRKKIKKVLKQYKPFLLWLRKYFYRKYTTY
jgi:hypothetical protein